MQNDRDSDTEQQLAETIKEACIQAAREGFHDTSLSGLCHEGAVEAAISAIEMVKLNDTIKHA